MTIFSYKIHRKSSNGPTERKLSANIFYYYPPFIPLDATYPPSHWKKHTPIFLPISDLVCVGSQNKWAKIEKLPSLISAVPDFDVRFHDPTLSTFLKTEQKQIILL